MRCSRKSFVTRLACCIFGALSGSGIGIDRLNNQRHIQLRAKYAAMFFKQHRRALQIVIDVNRTHRPRLSAPLVGTRHQERNRIRTSAQRHRKRQGRIKCGKRLFYGLRHAFASGLLGIGKAPVALQTRVTAVEQRIDFQIAHLAIGIGERLFQQRGGLLVVAVRAA